MSTYKILMIAIVIWVVVMASVREQTYRVWKLFIAPVVFISLLVYGMQREFALNTCSYFLVGGGLMLGIAIGGLLRKNSPIRINKQKRLIHVPGSFYALFTFIFIFTIHFMIGFLQADSPEVLRQADEISMLLFSLAVVSGMPAGQSLCLFLKYYYAKNNLDTESLQL